MKKLTVFLTVMIIAAGLLCGCGSTSASDSQQELKVYSICGESDDIAVSGGVLVLNGDEQVFYGGNVELKQADTDNIYSYSMEFYVLSPEGDTEGILIKNFEDCEGQDIVGDAATIRGEDIITGDIEDIQDSLYIKIETEDKDGSKDEHILQLEVTDVI